MLELVSLALALAVAVAPSAQAAGTHPFTVHDLLAMDRLSDPQPSPDGKRIAFVVSVTDLEANRRRASIWTVPTAGGAPTRLTTHADGGDSSPRWSPDGRFVYFLSGRGDTSQVWRIAVDGGEAQAVTELPLDVNAFVLSPDGKSLAVALDVFVDCADLACTQKRLDDVAARKATGKLYDRLFVRHWDTWSDGRRTHLFVVPVAGGKPVDVMKGMDADSPSKPFGGPEEVAFTPDSRGLVFSARDVGREEAWSTNFDLFLAPADGSAAPRRLTTSQAWDTQPAFSPDGKTLAYLAQATPAYESDRFRIVLRAWPKGDERVLTEAWDRSPQSIVWSADGKRIFTVAQEVGQQPVFAVDVKGGAVRKLYGDGVLKGLVRAGDRLVFTRETLRGPAELHATKLDGGDLRTLTHFNDAKVAGIAMGEPSMFSFKGANDDTVWGWVVKPAKFDPKRKYPVALLIHGGPQGSFNNDFHYRWNPQSYAGAGFAAVTVDFHGSTGYGQKFTDSIQGDWGGKPFVDIQRGLAAALAQNPWMDGNSVCALGASFGGFMINWIAGNWPDRFRCLVNHDGNLDERAAYYDTEELWFPERDHMGTPWENPQGYEKHNPVNYVKNWKTPMLVVHGGRDYRVVDTQGISTFNALQRRGIPSKLLYFPEENHWVLKPHNTILWHETVLGWLGEWTRGGGVPAVGAPAR